MHELSITENILNLTLDHARQAGAERVTDLYLVIGQFSSIVDDSVQFYWDLISKDTICEGAQLHFERIAAQICCQECEATYPVPEGMMPCPQCGSSHVTILSGDEFRLDSIGIDTAVPAAQATPATTE